MQCARHLNCIQVSRPVCEAYQHSDGCLLGDHITNALENVLAVGLLNIYNLMLLMYSVYMICAHTTILRYIQSDTAGVDIVDPSTIFI